LSPPLPTSTSSKHLVESLNQCDLGLTHVLSSVT
jgi:hypothetical protein